MQKIVAAFIILLSLITGLLQAQTLDYRFVVVGCNRVNPGDAPGPSTANVYHLNRTFLEVSQLSPLPKYFFFAGDLIDGVGGSNDTAGLLSEYTGWKQLYANSSLSDSGVQMVTIMGNHESESSDNSLAYPAAERTFIRNMSEFIIGNNGPKALGLTAGTDSLITDQSQLTYSFNYKNLSTKNDHFVIINTDAVGRDWKAPFVWVNNDVTAARQASSTRHIFVMGHKPAYPSPITPTDGLVMYPYQRNMFWNALQNNRAEAMFAAHNHNWDTVHYNYNQPALSTWQVIAGNGGSPISGAWSDPYYGYTVVNVYTNGQVTVQNYGRDINPNAYTASIPTVLTTLKGTFNITWPTTITHTPIANSQANGPFTGSATIIDNDSVYSAYVIYSVNGGAKQDTINLTDSANVYKFTIPAQADTGAGYIEYKIIANGSTVASYPTASTATTFAFNGALAVIPPLPSATDIKVYPNPTTGTLTIDLSSHKGITSITFQNINGIGLKNITNINSSIITTDISSLPPGTYFMLFTNVAGQQFVKKIIKN